jgi:hypothetical protein
MKITEKEISFIKENYQKGIKFCADTLNRHEQSIINHLNKLNIKFKVGKWTLKEKKFIQDNFLENGLSYCIEKLNRSDETIITKAKVMGLLNDNKYKWVQPFINIENKEHAYILGLLWSDGSLCKNRNQINLTIKESDFKEIKHYFKEWSISKKNDNCVSVTKTNECVADFLRNNDYDKKSIKSPTKILKLIPEEFRGHFFRGLIDGDGCFYINEKNGNYQFTITSTYDYDWKDIENLFTFLEIKFSIQRIERKRGKHSCIRITNKKGVKKLGDYIYNEYDGIGLARKYEKYLLY